MTLRRTVPYWRAKLGPRAPIWAEDNTLWRDDGLQHGSPSKGLAFALTMQPWVKAADKKLAAIGGCARFGMDDGYMIGLREAIFQVLPDFANGIRESTGCGLVARTCKMYSLDEGAWDDCNARGLIPEELNLVEEEVHVTENGDCLKGIKVFNVHIGEPRYVEAVLRNKAIEVAEVARRYVEDLEDKYPQEL